MKVIDLSQDIFDGQKSHFRVTVTDYLTHKETASRLKLPAEGYGTKVLMMCDHTSTHVDAPSHYWPNRRNIDEMPIDCFCGEAIVVDCLEEVADKTPLTIDMFMKISEKQGVALKEGDIVLINLVKDSQDIYGGISKELAEYLVAKKIKMLGTDRGTPDSFSDLTKPVHVTLMKNDIPIVEGLRNLEQLRGKRFFFVGLPLKIQKGTGSPIRAAAIIGDDENDGAFS